MTIHEFGDKSKPSILLLPGTMCFWKGNFAKVIPDLSQDFHVLAVAYTGFDEKDEESYHSLPDEVIRIEAALKKQNGGNILAAYGCSLGGSVVCHLVRRNVIHIRYAILGSSDLDQAGRLRARILSSLMIKLVYPFLHTGQYSNKWMQKRYEKQMASLDPYNKAFVSLVGRDRYDMSFLSKESLRNQFESDLTTRLEKHIDNKETEIHIFYARKMGKKYLKRYRLYFKNPIIHDFDLRHEELLGVYPERWCSLIKEICLK